MNESLKRQETQFKAHCKEEKARLEAGIARLKTAGGEGDSEEQVETEANYGVGFVFKSVCVQERIAAIMKHYEADKEKLQKIRALLVSGSLLTLLLLYLSLCTGTQES